MNPNWEYIRNTIDKFPEYRSAIFEQGFILTNRQLSLGNGFPFFGNWRCEKLSGGLFAYVHVTQKLYLFKKNNTVYFLLGHAYDPFAYQWDENEILSSLADCSDGDFEKGLAKINDLTGLFVLGMINGEKITFCGDFESMRTAYYGCINGSFYLVSHEELAAFFEELHFDPYVRKLEQYRWYRLYGEGLPGNISHYLELKKLVANNCIVFAGGSFRTVRIWPRGEIEMCASEDVYEKVVDDIARIMQRSLELIAKKWARPAISATGGRDSKGSLAASVHIRERFQYFSYDSQPAERVDCDAAEAICRAAGVPHDTYRIPLDRQLYPEYELVKAIHCANSNRLYFNHNDLMKRICFRKAQRFDVEVKSWTSEIGRAFCYQRYGVKRMQKRCSARRLTALNDIFLFNPILMYQTDARYRAYLRESEYNQHMFNYDWSDIAIVEMRDSRWGSDVISCEHMFAYDITVPYNNRSLSDKMLTVPLEKRIADRTHIDFTDRLCPKINATNIAVRDAAHDDKRMWLDKIYYFSSCIRPF